ncbi:MAG: hypothetical protein AB7G93_15190 [Bdellovibrionales bacterium]
MTDQNDPGVPPGLRRFIRKAAIAQEWAAKLREEPSPAYLWFGKLYGEYKLKSDTWIKAFGPTVCAIWNQKLKYAALFRSDSKASLKALSRTKRLMLEQGITPFEFRAFDEENFKVQIGRLILYRGHGIIPDEILEFQARNTKTAQGLSGNSCQEGRNDRDKVLKKRASQVY